MPIQVKHGEGLNGSIGTETQHKASIIEPNDTPTDELEANKTKVTTSGSEQCEVFANNSQII